MTFISSTKLAVSLNDNAGARLRSTVQEWPGRKTRELLPGLLLNLVTFAFRLLPGMATFSPTMLSLIIGIVLHNIVRAAASPLRWVTVKGFRPFLLGALVFFIAGLSLTRIGSME